MITCKWYQKPTDTGTFLNFRSCTPLQHKKDIIQGTINRLVRCTCNWKNFDEAFKVKEKNWLKNQNPVCSSSKVVNETQKFLHYRTKLNRLFAQKTSNDSLQKNKNELLSFVLQHKDNLSVKLKEKLTTAAK